MTKRALAFSPLDAWFFRDGRPFNQGETNQADAPSQFPPAAYTVIGAIRAALARRQGWDGHGKWDPSINPILGTNFDDIGKLCFYGPYLVKIPQPNVSSQSTPKIQYVFPIPLHVMGYLGECNTNGKEVEWKPWTFLTPKEDNKYQCDLGKALFVEILKQSPPNKKLKQGENLWITCDGLQKILTGNLPSPTDCIPTSDLWRMESRVGLERDPITHSPVEGHLYSPQYVRMLKDVELAMEVEGIPEDWTLPDLIPFGGESRTACLRTIDTLSLPAAPCDAIKNTKKLTVTLLTPLLLQTDKNVVLPHPQPEEPFPNMPGTKIVSACVGKPIRFGGWNSLDTKPLPLTPFLPAGSMWFLKIEDKASPEEVDHILGMHGKKIGEKTKFGFGQIVLGVWPQHQGEKP